MLFRPNFEVEDFLLFSERVYTRMFELHNAAVWPLHIVAMGIGLYLVLVALHPRALLVQIAFGLLSAVWLFVAVAFLYGRYATINWAIDYVVPLYGMMVILLAYVSIRSRSDETPRAFPFSFWLALSALVFALIGYPLVGVWAGRPWETVELFGISPDPTAIATLAFLAIIGGPGTPWIMIIPTLWVMITAITLYALGRGDFYVAPSVAIACLAVYALTARRPVP